MIATLLKSFLPVILSTILKLLADKKFKNMVWEIAVIEIDWLQGELDADDAWDKIQVLLTDYFGMN
jgi:hypothetical protein